MLVDGRLDVGTHLPLLGGRFQYLSVLGEGISAQVSHHIQNSSNKSNPTDKLEETQCVELCFDQLCCCGLQVVLARDTYRAADELVAIKIMKRNFASSGTKVRRTPSVSVDFDIAVIGSTYHARYGLVIALHICPCLSVHIGEKHRMLQFILDEICSLYIAVSGRENMALQEVRALRWLESVAPSAAIAHLRGCFMFAGHVCLVLPRLYPSLLDCIVESAALNVAAQITQLRDVAFKLLVEPLTALRHLQCALRSIVDDEGLSMQLCIKGAKIHDAQNRLVWS